MYLCGENVTVGFAWGCPEAEDAKQPRNKTRNQQQQKMWNFYSDNSCAREVNSSVSWKWQMSVLLPTYGQVHSCVCFPHRRYFDAANHFISHVMIYFKWMSHQISDYTLVYLQIFLFVWMFQVDFSLHSSAQKLSVLRGASSQQTQKWGHFLWK